MTIRPEPAKNQPLNLYSYADETGNLQAGRIFYRIRQVDADGKIAYSAVQVVSLSPISSVTFYPNPARDRVHVLGWETVSGIQLYDLSGRLALTTGTVTGSLDIHRLLPGIYQARLFLKNGSVKSEKLQVR